MATATEQKRRAAEIAAAQCDAAAAKKHDLVAVGKECIVVTFAPPFCQEGILTSVQHPKAFISRKSLPREAGSCTVLGVPNNAEVFRNRAAAARWVIARAREIAASYEDWLGEEDGQHVAE